MVRATGLQVRSRRPERRVPPHFMGETWALSKTERAKSLMLLVGAV